MRSKDIFTEKFWDSMTSDLPLSPQLKRLALYLVRGLDDRTIAKQMGLAVPTIRSHLARLYASLNVEDRSGAILFFLRKVRQTYNRSQQEVGITVQNVAM